MRYATPRLRRAATQLLAREAEGGQPATSENLAAAAGRLLDGLSQRLAEVIGHSGVQAVFLRAVNLCRPAFPFLDERMVPLERGQSMAAPLRACLEEQAPELIREASVTLFATFGGLLATVIGDRLTWSLLQQVWPDTLISEAEVQEPQE
jgi:hypothetical protein